MSEIAYYVLHVHVDDAHEARVDDVRHATLAAAQKAAKKRLDARDAYKISIMGHRASGALFHSMPVRIMFGKGGNWFTAVTTYNRSAR